MSIHILIQRCLDGLLDDVRLYLHEYVTRIMLVAVRWPDEGVEAEALTMCVRRSFGEDANTLGGGENASELG